MDLNMSVSAIGIGISLFVVFLSLLLGRTRKDNGRLRLPGPFALPIIGNLHQFGALPHRTLQRLAEKHGPIMSLKLGSVNVVVASSSEAAKLFLKTHDLSFANRPSGGPAKYLFYNQKDILYAPYDAYWREMRRICVGELLGGKRMESFRGVMEEEAVAMVESMWKKSEGGRVGVDVNEIVACYTSNFAWRMLTGRTNGDSDLEEVIKEVTYLMGAVNIGEFIPWLGWLDLQGLRRRMKNVHQQVDAVLDKIIDEHLGRRSTEENQRHKDLLDALLDTEIPLEDKKAIIFVMLIATIDTSTTTLEWAMSEIMRNPSVMKKLQEETNSIVKQDEKITYSHILRMEYLHCVVKETFRLYPPAPLLIPHECREACIVQGPDRDYFIPTKTRFIVNAWAIGRDPRVWKDPLEFRPERFMGKNFDIINDIELSMIPFGAGRRSCPGASMGISIVEVALGHLFHNFDLKSEDDIDMNESFGITIHSKDHLFVIPSWRLSLNAPSSLKI